MGGESSGLNLVSQPPVVVLVAGLQGVGKTTTVGKLAALLKEREKNLCWLQVLMCKDLRQSNN